MSESAFDIYQRNCDAVARAVWDRDFELALAHNVLPNRLATPESDVTIPDAESLRRALSELRESLGRLGATAFLRICKDAVFDPADEHRIIGRHVSYVLRGGTNILPPYESRMVLKCTPEGWKAAEVFADVSNRYMTVISPGLAMDKRTPGT